MELAARGERRRAAIVVGVLVVFALAAFPWRTYPIGDLPAFFGAYGSLLFTMELLTAGALLWRGYTTGEGRVGILAGAYTFSAILVFGNVISLPWVTHLPIPPQSAPWMWTFWHLGWGLFVNAFVWRAADARMRVSALTLVIVSAGIAVVLVLIGFFGTGLLPLQIDANGAWTRLLKWLFVVTLATDAAAFVGFVRRGRRMTSLDVWVSIALAATLLEVALITVSSVRFSLGFYAARMFSILSGIAVLSSLVVDQIALARANALQQRQNEFRALGETVGQMMWTALADGWVDWYNKRWFAYTGQTPDEATGWGWQAVHHPEDFADVMRRWPHALATGEPLEMETRLRSASGDFRWFLLLASPLRDESGGVVRWFGTLTDINDQKLRIERSQRIALTLQQVFLPDQLPQRDDVAFDATYVPAESDAFVGGDWYDALTLPDGRVLISIGDVAGHGLDAAVEAGRLRQIVVSEALNAGDAVTILERADRLLRIQSTTIATALVAFYDPLRFTLTYASSGHPAPVLAAPGVRARLLPDGGPPLGTGFVPGGILAHAHVVDIPADALLVFYTDGVIEIDRDVLDGEAKLLAAVDRIADATTTLSAAALLHDVHGGRAAPDDIAMLLMRRTMIAPVRRAEALPVKTWRFHSSSAQSARDSRVALMEFVREHAADDADVFTAELILGELLANTVEHAPGLVEVLIDWTQPQPTVRVRDSGPGLDALGDGLLPSDAMSEDGRGLFLIATLAQDVRVSRAPGFGTEISVRLPLVRRSADAYARASS